MTVTSVPSSTPAWWPFSRSPSTSLGTIPTVAPGWTGEASITVLPAPPLRMPVYSVRPGENSPMSMWLSVSEASRASAASGML